MIRAFIASNDFDLSDWHTDASLRAAKDEICLENDEHVAVFTLKGPHTMFTFLPTKEMREEFNIKADIENYPSTVDDELLKRKALHQMLNVSNLVSANFGQGSVFFCR